MTDTSTTINISSIKDDVKKTLSLVGKRSVDRQGNTLFASVTLSSAEECLIDSFLNEGVHIFFGEVAPVVFGSEDGEIITLAINASRVNETKLSLFQSNAEGFVKNFALKKAFNASGQTEQSKNADLTMQQHLDSAIKLVFCKDSPSGDGGNFNITASASVDNSEKTDGYNTDGEKTDKDNTDK